MKKIGIDISEWNDGLDYTTISRQINFVIIREGYRTKRDKLFMTHVNAFRALGTPIQGVYHFIYATTESGAVKEAESALKNVKDAGLPNSTFIWCDFEYDTVDKAKKDGVILTPSECNKITRAFCDAIMKAGYPTGVYTNKDFYVNWYTPETIKRYPLWLADYAGDPDYPCLIQQYTDHGSLAGCSETFDMNYWYDGGAMGKIGNGYIRGYARPKYGEMEVEISDGVSDQKKTTVQISLDEVSFGSTGASVKLLQKLLDCDGYIGSNNEHLDIDGEAGKNTIFALKEYQSNNGLTADGICGKKTWKSLIY